MEDFEIPVIIGHPDIIAIAIRHSVRIIERVLPGVGNIEQVLLSKELLSDTEKRTVEALHGKEKVNLSIATFPLIYHYLADKVY